MKKAWIIRLLLALLAFTLSATAQELVFQLDPAQSTVSYTVDATMHTVHGTFRLKPSSVLFDPQTGAASGAFIVDATSGESGNDGRDKKMHKDVLESAKYPEIRFTVQRFQGTLPPSGTSPTQLTGTLTLHGGDHPMTVAAPVEFTNGHATADVHFVVPYVQWGLKDPSTLFLRVSKTVDINVHAVGTLVTQAAAVSPAHQR